MSLRDGARSVPSKQPLVALGGCSPALQHTCPGGRCQGTQCGASVAKCSRNDMQEVSLRELQSLERDRRILGHGVNSIPRMAPSIYETILCLSS